MSGLPTDLFCQRGCRVVQEGEEEEGEEESEESSAVPARLAGSAARIDRSMKMGMVARLSVSALECVFEAYCGESGRPEVVAPPPLLVLVLVLLLL